MDTHESPQTLAFKVGQTMFAQDTASKDTMGMQLMECLPGSAQMRMKVTEKHLNGHGMPFDEHAPEEAQWRLLRALNF